MASARSSDGPLAIERADWLKSRSLDQLADG
jgi:hypothetical protein